jgi:hypothetical protein
LNITDVANCASNQSMKLTAHYEMRSVCLPRHRAVAYLFLVRRREAWWTWKPAICESGPRPNQCRGRDPLCATQTGHLDGKLGELCDRSPVSCINWHDAKVSSMVHSLTRIGPEVPSQTSPGQWLPRISL